MQEKIRNHINELFAEAPKTRKAMDLKEEMTQNTIEKYEDLIREGYSEEDALQNVIHSIGDVTELFQDLEERNLLTLPEKDRQKKALLTAISVGLYILAGVAFVYFQFIATVSYNDELGLLGLVIAGAICIPPTCMLVYAANMYPNYQKRKEESLVELYKEARYSSNQEKAIKRSVSVIIWTIILVSYFIISFATDAWYITWVIFLIGACAQAVSELIFSIKRH